MNVYKVEFVETLGESTFSTFVNVRAKSEDEAETWVRRTQRNLARTHYGNVPFEIIILSVTRVGSMEEQILDRLWDINQDLYYELWEPGISTTQMITGLIENHPDVYKSLAGG